MIKPTTTDSLMLEVPMNEGSGSTTYDYSGNGYDGTITGAAYVKTPFGGSYSLDFTSASSNKILFPLITEFQDSGSFTVITWVKPESLPTYANIWSFRNDYLIETRFNNGNVEFDLSAAYLHPVTKLIATASSPISAGNWYCIVSRYDSTTGMELFINNVSVGTNTWTGTFTSGQTYYNYIGSQGNDVNYFDGIIAPIIFYDRAVSNEELTAIYQNTYRA